jgi:hypothetical protein
MQFGILGLAAGIVVTAVGIAGYSLGMLNTSQSNQNVPPAMLNAMGATHGETIAMATGPMDDCEALYVLDYLTGDLQCWVIESRTGKFNSLFKYNVTADLAVEQGKKPDYVMVTGSAGFRGGGIANNLGSSVCYVADGNTGNVAAYAVPWNSAASSQGRAQSGNLILLHVGKARMAAIRDVP